MGKAKRICGPKPKCKPHEFDENTHGVRAEPVVVIVVPTRELALQIWDECRRLSYRSYLRPAVAYGGLPTKQNVYDLKRSCDILIATPGRLIHLLTMGNVLSFERVKYAHYPQFITITNVPLDILSSTKLMRWSILVGRNR